MNKRKNKKLKVVSNQVENKLDDYLQLLDTLTSTQINLNKLENLTNLNREQIYNTLDTMCLDGQISAVLETFASDVCETNMDGKIIWCVSDNSDITDYINNFLLQKLEIEKKLNKWVYQLLKYGDIYIQLFTKDINKITSLKEDIKVNLPNSKEYELYVEEVDNPAEMFDLVNKGKSCFFLKIPKYNNYINSNNSFQQYSLKQQDTEIYSPLEFVHASLNSGYNRRPEIIEIIDDQNEVVKYKIKSGQSYLFNTFKFWREKNLLEQSVLLNRVSRSALVQILSINMKDTPKNKVKDYILSLKNLIEQKISITQDNGMTSLNNNGPISNVIVTATNDDQGKIEAQTLGGDIDPKQLTDLDWWNNKLYGALKVPKQYFGYTDDSTGFNGGTSLTILSSQYGKLVKSVKRIMCSLVTDIINLHLMNRIPNYIGNFRIVMQDPITQESIDLRTNKNEEFKFKNDVINTITNFIEDPIKKLEIMKSELSSIITNDNTLNIIDDLIEQEKNKLNTSNIEENNIENNNVEDISNEEDINNNSSDSLMDEIENNSSQEDNDTLDNTDEDTENLPKINDLEDKDFLSKQDLNNIESED